MLSTEAGTKAQRTESRGLILQAATLLLGVETYTCGITDWKAELEGASSTPAPIIKRKLRPKEVKSTRARAGVGSTGFIECCRQT